MKDDRGMGTAGIILVLAVLIILILIFRQKFVELTVWFYRDLSLKI